jgi:pimeloyl-ACP methyl ester carboxylesterase
MNSPAEWRKEIREGRWRNPTAGLAPGYAQANLVVVPEDYAYDFLLFCQRNPKPCPLLDVTDPGDPVPRYAAPGADLRTDLPRYRVYRDGELVEEPSEVSGLWRDDVPIRNIATYPPEELPKALFYDPEGEVARMVLAMPQDGEEAAEAQARFIWAMASTIGKFAWPIPDKGLKKRIYRIRAPTLIVWGKDDRLVPPVYAEEFARRIPGARVAMIERAGHLPQLEQLEQVLPTVRQFLAA